ncbi:MAG: hypothetical protein LBG27_04755 [Spirochaetaceae bacterium]|nr:hypothetical protein [Spirochaetaceae bacterium]
MVNKKLFAGTRAVVLVFEFVRAGAVRQAGAERFPLLMDGFSLEDFLGGGSKTSATPETEQLAADLNAIKAGSATVEGATVRFTGEVNLTTGLTVPLGVSLDLTADVNSSGHGNQGGGWVEGDSAFTAARRSSTGAEPSAFRSRDACSASVAISGIHS